MDVIYKEIVTINTDYKNIYIEEYLVNQDGERSLQAIHRQTWADYGEAANSIPFYDVRIVPVDQDIKGCV